MKNDKKLFCGEILLQTFSRSEATFKKPLKKANVWVRLGNGVFVTEQK